MKVSDFLTKVGKCKTEEDAKKLTAVLKKELYETVELYGEGFSLANEEVVVAEDEGVSIRFDLVHVISDDFAITIQPRLEIDRDTTTEELTVLVETVQMRDRRGMGSQDWVTVDGLEDVIEPRPHWELSAVMEAAAKELMRQHVDLMERVGVPTKQAQAIVASFWEGGAK